MLRLCILWLAGLVVVPALAADQPHKPPPWHLVDIWWDMGEDQPFESYAIDVTISADVPSSVNLYIAPIGLGQLSGIKFYGGIQTQADGYSKATAISAVPADLHVTACGVHDGPAGRSRRNT